MKKLFILRIFKILCLFILFNSSLYAQRHFTSASSIEITNVEGESIYLNQLPNDKYILIRSKFQQCSNCMKLLLKHLSIYKNQIPLIIVTDKISSFQLSRKLQNQWQESYFETPIIMCDKIDLDNEYVLDKQLHATAYPILLLYQKTTNQLFYFKYDDLFIGNKTLKIKKKTAKIIQHFYHKK